MLKHDVVLATLDDLVGLGCKRYLQIKKHAYRMHTTAITRP